MLKLILWGFNPRGSDQQIWGRTGTHAPTHVLKSARSSLVDTTVHILPNSTSCDVTLTALKSTNAKNQNSFPTSLPLPPSKPDVKYLPACHRMHNFASSQIDDDFVSPETTLCVACVQAHTHTHTHMSRFLNQYEIVASILQLLDFKCMVRFKSLSFKRERRESTHA